MTNPDAKALDEWLQTKSEKIHRNVTIVTADDVGQDHMLHISTNTNIRRFIPFISERASPMEDKSVPRVCVAPTVVGCLIGYAQSEQEFLMKPSDGKDGSGYKGGWKIYALPFKAALKPSAKLVWDSRMSDEYWLVSYNKDSVEYIPEAAGKMFIQSIIYKARSGKTPEAIDATYYMEVTKEEGIRFSKRFFLTKGFWKIEGAVVKHVYSANDDSGFVVTELSRAEYSDAKNQSAALLGLEDKIPAYAQW